MNSRKDWRLENYPEANTKPRRGVTLCIVYESLGTLAITPDLMGGPCDSSKLVQLLTTIFEIN